MDEVNTLQLTIFEKPYTIKIAGHKALLNQIPDDAIALCTKYNSWFSASLQEIILLDLTDPWTRYPGPHSKKTVKELTKIHLEAFFDTIECISEIDKRFNQSKIKRLKHIGNFSEDELKTKLTDYANSILELKHLEKILEPWFNHYYCSVLGEDCEDEG